MYFLPILSRKNFYWLTSELKINSSDFPSVCPMDTWSIQVNKLLFVFLLLKTIKQTLLNNTVDEKLIRLSKKEMENFIRAKFEDFNPRKASQEALRIVPPVRSQGIVI